MKIRKYFALLMMVCMVFVMMPIAVSATEGEAVTIEGKGTSSLTDIIGDTDFAEVISFSLYDANGEKITYKGVLDVEKTSETYLQQLRTEEANALVAEQGWSNASVAGTGAVKIVEQPSDSALAEADVNLEWVSTVLTIKSAKEITAEGKYTFEVVLDNGATATASCDAKAFRTPVELKITGTTCVEQGAPAYLQATWYDENGVPKNATNAETVEWKVEGAAGYHWLKGASRYAILGGVEEECAGAPIEVTLIDSESGLTATHTVKVAAPGEKTLQWNKSDAVIGEENAYTVRILDSDGDAVKLCCCSASVEYVVLEQPEGANVTVTGNWKGSQGQSGNMTLVSDQAGEVKVQATVTFEMSEMEKDADGNLVEKEAGTRNYTDTHVFSVSGGAETEEENVETTQTIEEASTVSTTEVADEEVAMSESVTTNTNGIMIFAVIAVAAIIVITMLKKKRA